MSMTIRVCLALSHVYATIFVVHTHTHRPMYFLDVKALLVGMECEVFLSDFAKSSVGLTELLNISDERLVEIGVSYPFQRKRIQTGLWNFHRYDWSPWLIRYLAKPPMKYSR